MAIPIAGSYQPVILEMFVRARLAVHGGGIAAPIHSRTYALKSWKRTSDSKDQPTEEAYSAARLWRESLRKDSIPLSKLAKITMTSARGPGGAGKDTANTKVHAHWAVKSLRPHLPEVVFNALSISNYCTKDKSTIHISSESSREKSKNEEDCYRKLRAELVDICDRVVPGVTSDSQRRRVKTLQAASNTKRLQEKKGRSAKKKSRGKSRNPDD